MNIKGKLGRWLKNFLTERQQVILVDKVKSKFSKLVSGIPQGSVLGPILFLIYISDIEVLQEELIKLDNWSKENNMDFNKGKFVVMRYGQNESLKNETEYFSGNYEESNERKDSVSDLGVQLTDNGAFEEHIDKVCKKVRQKKRVALPDFLLKKHTFP